TAHVDGGACSGALRDGLGCAADLLVAAPAGLGPHHIPGTRRDHDTDHRLSSLDTGWNSGAVPATIPAATIVASEPRRRSCGDRSPVRFARGVSGPCSGAIWHGRRGVR